MLREFLWEVIDMFQIRSQDLQEEGEFAVSRQSSPKSNKSSDKNDIDESRDSEIIENLKEPKQHLQKA